MSSAEAAILGSLSQVLSDGIVVRLEDDQGCDGFHPGVEIQVEVFGSRSRTRHVARGIVSRIVSNGTSRYMILKLAQSAKHSASAIRKRSYMKKTNPTLQFCR